MSFKKKSLEKKEPVHKIIMAGSGGVGKSSITLQYCYKEFSSDYEPTKADSYRKEVTLNGLKTVVEILDTAGQEDFAAIRDNYLRWGEGFMCVFSLIESESLAELGMLREQILRVKGLETIPMILVGNKVDLETMRVIPKADAEAQAAEWGVPYLETSAKAYSNIEEAFNLLLSEVQKHKDATVAAAKAAKLAAKMESKKGSFKNSFKRNSSKKNKESKKEEEESKAEVKKSKKRCLIM